MISRKETIINQLLGTIYTDKSDPTVLHINMDNALKILIASGLNIPKKQYEHTLDVLLSKRIVGAPTGNITKVAMSELMYALASEMSISKEEILKYTMMQEKSDGIKIKD